MVNGMDDKDDPHNLVALEAMSSLSKLLHHVEERDIQSMLLHIAIRIRPFFDSVRQRRGSRARLVGRPGARSAQGSRARGARSLLGCLGARPGVRAGVGVPRPRLGRPREDAVLLGRGAARWGVRVDLDSSWAAGRSGRGVEPELGDVGALGQEHGQSEPRAAWGGLSRGGLLPSVLSVHPPNPSSITTGTLEASPAGSIPPRPTLRLRGCSLRPGQTPNRWDGDPRLSPRHLRVLPAGWWGLRTAGVKRGDGG